MVGTLDVEQECPPRGCWWQKADIARRVLTSLPSNRDVLTCDLVCAIWEELKVRPVVLGRHLASQATACTTAANSKFARTAASSFGFRLRRSAYYVSSSCHSARLVQSCLVDVPHRGLACALWEELRARQAPGLLGMWSWVLVNPGRLKDWRWQLNLNITAAAVQSTRQCSSFSRP